jgi:hypothetical protein
MARYRVQGPGGKIHVFEGPDGAQPADIEAFAAQTFGGAKPREQRAAEDRERMRAEYAPTGGFFENLAAGGGSGLASVLRAVGGGRLAGAMGLPATKEEAERLDAPLMETGGGQLGRGLGVAAPALLAVPFTAPTLAGAAAAGAATGALTTEGGVGERAQGAALGGAGGALGQAVAPAYRAVKGAARGLVEPFTKGGADRIAGRAIDRFATNRNALDELITASRPQTTGARPTPMQPTATGALPTLAEATGDGGLMTLQRAIGTMDPEAAAMLAARQEANNAARVNALQGIAGGPAKLAAAEAARDAAARPLYDAADNAVVQLDGAFGSLMNRPAFKNAVQQAEALAKNEGLADLFFRGANGEPVAITGQGAHFIKKALDDMADKQSATYMGDAAAGAAGKTQQAFLGWLDKTVPEYGAAKAAFAAGSKPINQMGVGQRLLDKTTASVRDQGQMRLQANAFSRALNDEEALVKGATGFRGQSLADVMDPQQMGTLGAVRNELEMLANLNAAANGPGSQTAKMLASQNLLRQAAGPLGLPESWAESVLSQTLMRPVQFAYRAAEPRIGAAIGRATLDPAEAAALVARTRAFDQSAITPNALQALMQRYLPMSGAGGAAAYGSGQ